MREEDCERTGAGAAHSIAGAEGSAVPAGTQREIIFGGGRELLSGWGCCC